MGGCHGPLHRSLRVVRSRQERLNDVTHAPEVAGPRIGGGFDSKYLGDAAETVRVCRTKRPLAGSVFVNHGAARNTQRGRRYVRFLTLRAKARAHETDRSGVAGRPMPARTNGRRVIGRCPRKTSSSRAEQAYALADLRRLARLVSS